MPIYHMTSNIQGLLNNYTSKKLDKLFDMENGEAKAELERLKAKGDKLIPSANCAHFDPVEGCQCRFHDPNYKPLF